MPLRVAVLFLALSLACPSEARAVAFHAMKGVLLNWIEGTADGSFDLDVGGDQAHVLPHFNIDMKQTTVDGTLVSHWEGGALSPFGTRDNPKRLCVLVAYYGAEPYLTALSITTLGTAKASSDPCS